MKIFLIAVLATVHFFSSNAFALASDGLISPSDFPGLTRQIQSMLLRETGFRQFENFRVDWSSRKCVKTATEMDHEVEVGACVVSASALQMEGRLVVSRTIDGYALTLLYANVE